MRNVIFILSYLLCWQCHSPQYSGKLREALEAAGENRGELERVLAHYAGEAGDKEKHAAACFLIENMPGHYTAHGRVLDSLRGRVDGDAAGYFARKAMDVMASAVEEWEDKARREEDVRHVTADLLIRHIDGCFALRERFAWCGGMPLKDFFRYVLPYRISHERLDGWRDSIVPFLPEKYRISDDVCYDSKEAGKYLQIAGEQEMAFSDTLVDQVNRDLTGDCVYLNLMRLLRKRLAGMPTAVDYFPHYADRNGMHCWLAEVDAQRLNPHIGDALPTTPAKIYRKTFERQRVVEGKPGETVPELFCDPFVSDVTEEYLRTADLVVPAAFRVKGKPRHVYLCVFSDLDWQPIAIGNWEKGMARFEKVGKGVVYLPVYYEGRRMRAFNYPFVLDVDGRMAFLEPDAGDTLRLRLERKYPYDELQYEYSAGLAGAAVEIADMPAGEGFEVVAHLPEENHYYFSVVLPDSLPACRHWQLRTWGYAYFAEVRFYDRAGVLVPADSLVYRSSAFDGDVLTNVRADRIRADFKSPVRVSRVVCLPRSDGNGVYPGEEYELLYYAADGWQSLGRKRAGDYFVEYGAVPAGGLYWLRNRTRGVEERVFTVQDGRVRFW